MIDGTARMQFGLGFKYHVYVKPTVANEVYFGLGADFTVITVDLLADGSSVFVNSPIRVAEPDGDIDIRATNVHLNAATETKDYFILGRSNSEKHPRLPRVSNPRGEQSTPTFRTLLNNDSITRPVAPTAVLNGSVGSLAVLPSARAMDTIQQIHRSQLNPPRSCLVKSRFFPFLEVCRLDS